MRKPVGDFVWWPQSETGGGQTHHETAVFSQCRLFLVSVSGLVCVTVSCTYIAPCVVTLTSLHP